MLEVYSFGFQAGGESVAMHAYAQIGVAGIGCEMTFHRDIASEATYFTNEIDVAKTLDFRRQLLPFVEEILLNETDGL